MTRALTQKLKLFLQTAEHDLNLKRCMIPKGVGLWCCFIVLTKVLYSVSVNLEGASKLHSRLYTVSPITVSNTALFFSFAVMSFTKKNCSSLLTYCVQSSCSGINSLNLPN